MAHLALVAARPAMQGSDATALRESHCRHGLYELDLGPGERRQVFVYVDGRIVATLLVDADLLTDDFRATLWAGCSARATLTLASSAPPAAGATPSGAARAAG